jgi:hypothetical protein
MIVKTNKHMFGMGLTSEIKNGAFKCTVATAPTGLGPSTKVQVGRRWVGTAAHAPGTNRQEVHQNIVEQIDWLTKSDFSIARTGWMLDTVFYTQFAVGRIKPLVRIFDATYNMDAPGRQPVAEAL